MLEDLKQLGYTITQIEDYDSVFEVYYLDTYITTLYRFNYSPHWRDGYDNDIAISDIAHMKNRLDYFKENK